MMFRYLPTYLPTIYLVHNINTLYCYYYYLFLCPDLLNLAQRAAPTFFSYTKIAITAHVGPWRGGALGVPAMYIDSI